MLGRCYAKRNRKHNEQFRIEGYIRSQNDEPVRHIKYGCKTMAYNGCEVIACYHALLSLGIKASFSEVTEACSEIGLWLLGLWGTRPRALYRFCRRYGLAYRRYRRREFDAVTEDVVLYAYWNPRFHGIHTVELHRTEYGYTVTNLGCLRGRTFPTMGNALGAIPTPMPILCLGVAKKQPTVEQNHRFPTNQPPVAG